MKKEKYRKIKKFFIISSPFILASFMASLIIEIKLALTILFAIFLLIGYSIYKEKIGQELIVAFLFATVVTSYYVYEYTTANILIGKINLYPLIAWTIGLVFLREIYENLTIKNKFTFITAFYLIGLFLLEYVGYYLLNIKLNSNFPSLLGLGIIHAPIEMKLFYLFAGPVYIAITNYLKVK